MAKSKAAAEDDVVVIKKYANRRLYDTERSCYITLEDLGAMVREGRDFSVIDAKSGEDITHNVLTQIIMDTETRGETMLPVNFLRHLIGLYGDKMQGLVRSDEHTSEPQSLMRISYAVFCLKKKKKQKH